MVLILVVGIILFIRSPWGQGIVVDKAVAYVSDKTGTELSIERLFITFSGNIYLEGLYIEDTKGDTLVYSKNLEAGVAFAPLLSTGTINLTKLEWQGLVARVSRSAETEKFNFDFLTEAFASQPADTTQVADTTASDPLLIKLSPISLRDFDITYVDELMGIDASILLGELDLTIPGLDLEEYTFDIKKIALQNSKIKYHQSKPFEASEETEAATLMPIINLDELTLKEVSADYSNSTDHQVAQIRIGNLLVELPEADLRNQIINLTTIELENSNILFHDFSTPTPNPTIEPNSSSAPFAWPEWKADLKQITLNNNQIEYKTSDTDFRKGYFNPEAIQIAGLHADLSNLILENKSAKAQVNSFQFDEASGFSLKEFSLAFALDDREASVNNLSLAINQSQLKGDLALTYQSIDQLLQTPETVSFDIDLEVPRLTIQDSYYFQPTLAQDTVIQKLEAYPFSADMVLDGSLGLLNISSGSLSWGKTNFFASGQISDLMDMDLLRFDFPEIQLKSNRETLLAFVSESDLGVQFPENFLLDGRASGQLNNLGLEADLTSTLGDLSLIVAYQDQKELAFDLQLEAKALQLNKLLQNQELDTIYFSLDAKGKGTTWYEMNADIVAKFDSLYLYQNDYSGLEFVGKLENGSGEISSDLDSKNLRYQLNAAVDLDSVDSKIDLQMNLIGADLGAMGLTPTSTRAQFQLDANFVGNLEQFEAHATFSDATLVHELKPYPLGTVWLNALVKNDTTSLDIESNPLTGFIQSNASPTEFTNALTSHINHYFGIKDTLKTSGEVIMNMNIAIRQDPLLNEVLLPSIAQLDKASVTANFSESKQALTASINFPYLNYAGTLIDSLGIQVDSDSSSFDFSLGFARLNSGPIAIDRTRISGDLDDSSLLLDMQFYEKEEILSKISSQIDFLSDSVKVKFLPDTLILNKMKWNIPATNSLLYSNQEITLTDMEFSSRNQKVQLTDKLDSLAKPHLAAIFNGFRLENVTSILNPERELASGLLQGRLIVQNPFGALGILSDLKIDSLSIFDTHLGTLTVDAQAKTIGNYELKANLSGGGADLNINGDFKSDLEAATFDLDIDLTRIELDMLKGILPDQITQADGVFQGKITANGNTAEPQYEGLLTFKEASLTPTILGTKYLFEDESIRLDNAGIYLDNFTVRDEAQNTFALDGEIGTESFVNPTFDLQVTAKRFMAINSTDKESELFFGKGTIDADISVKGDLLLPVIRGKLAVKDATDLTFIVPESELEIVARQGVVRFVNKENPDDILTRNDINSSNSFAGYDIRLQLEVDPTARFKIIIDPNSGDNLALTASGELDLAVDPIGRTSLSGRLEIQDGHYEMTLYSLVNRRFEIVKGSTIVWNGDPLDATLDISASYEVRTAAAPLMAAQLTGSGSGTQNQYNKRLDFFVYLYLDGELLKPEISFGLDMPENERGEFGGNVYSQVRQLGEQEGELNRQVFSLLVLNRFFPSGGSDGSGGGTEALARNSVSQLLSDQLNNFSNQLFGDSGFEVGFEVDSYTQGQGGKSQTELNVSAQQTLFNDRLTVQVGSQFDVEGNSQTSQDVGAILGNVSIEYTLTEDGRFKIRAFRKNQFESVIDGQLVVTGLGLVFNREFNSFSQIWGNPMDSEVKMNPIDELDDNSNIKKKNTIENKQDEN